ncbi:MAG: hypothetical protein SCK29_14775 [Bacillota bacterium]|nr:hypothetical protein [Bacillota bacterium]
MGKLRYSCKRFAYIFLYSIFLMVILLQGEHYRFLLRRWTGRTFDPVLGLVFLVVFPVFLGLLLALPKFLGVWRQQGRWRYDVVKFLAVGIPAFYIILSVPIMWIPVLRPLVSIYPGYWRSLTMQASVMNVAGIVIGYMSLSALYKKAVNNNESVE